MKQTEAVNQFLAGRRVVIAKFVAHRYKKVQNKAKKVVGIVNLYEVQFADGKAPTVQTWCPRSVQTVEQAAKECPCQFGAALGMSRIVVMHGDPKGRDCGARAQRAPRNPSLSERCVQTRRSEGQL